MNLNRVAIGTIAAHIILGTTFAAQANHIDKVYIKPDPVPAFMRQPCQLNDNGVPYWNCYYDARTMYKEGRSKRSYYQVRAWDTDRKHKFVCVLYWKQKIARRDNVCLEW